MEFERNGGFTQMTTKHFHLLLNTIIILFLLAACGSVPKTTPATSSPTSAPLPTNTTAPAATSTAASASGDCVNAYYPDAVGDTWAYSSSGGAKGNYTYTRAIPTSSDTGFSISDRYSTGVDWSAKWTCKDGNLAALDAGPESATMTTSKYTLTSNSVTADGFNIPAAFVDGSAWSEKVMIDGTVQGSSGKSINSQIISQLDCTAGGADTITVPAGKFDAVKAVCTKKVVVSAVAQGKNVQLGANQEDITYWYAKNVGYVKSVATGGSNNETIVLTQYKIQ
jgi:hypothetical protein